MTSEEYSALIIWTISLFFWVLFVKLEKIGVNYSFNTWEGCFVSVCVDFPVKMSVVSVQS